MRVLKIIGFSALIMLTFSSYAKADMTISQYRARKDTVDVKAYVWGLENAFGTANARLLIENKAPLYCEPRMVTMKYEDLTFLIDEQADLLDRQGKLKSDTTIAGILLVGLQRKFPCGA